MRISAVLLDSSSVLRWTMKVTNEKEIALDMIDP
jgi:hypothetical protein